MPVEAARQGAYSHTQDAKRKFVTATYRERSQGRPDVDVPGVCPWGGDGEGCRVHVHHWRDRTFGPGHELLVVVCVTHDRAFTLYPPGWFPFARKPAAVSSMEWTETVFEAAVDAASGGLWPERRGRQEYVRLATTQRRHIARCGRWLGLVGDDGDAVADELGVRLAEHRAWRRQWGAASDRRQRGRVIRDALDAVPREVFVVRNVLRVVIRDRFRWHNDRSDRKNPA